MSTEIRTPGGSGRPGLNRRSFFQTVGAAAAGTVLTGGLSACSNGFAGHSLSELEQRQADAHAVRLAAAELGLNRPLASHVTNGDEELYPSRIGSYTKGLPHDAVGEVIPAAYQTYVDALDAGDMAPLENVGVGPIKLENPAGGLAYALCAPDSPSALTMPPPPTFASAQQAEELTELYWMALLRDLAFTDYDTHADAAAAAAELNALSSIGSITTSSLFRPVNAGTRTGPYLSQFLLQPAGFGALTMDQKIRTVQPGLDYLTDQASWLAIQNGQFPSVAHVHDGTPRHLRNLRDLAAYVEADVTFQAYVNAAQILFGMGCPLNPTFDVYAGSNSTVGFVTMGPKMIVTFIAEAAYHALKAVWYQKWFVHRRLRPEEMGGRVHMHTTAQANYPIHADVLNSEALSRVQVAHGTSFLPMAFPQGSPRHPAYGAGHNTVAGACGTLLKAFFDTEFPVSNPVVADASGTGLVPYVGPGAGQMTVGGEIDKLVSNIAMARNAAGVHWRSDAEASFVLGEEVAIGFLKEQKLTLNEKDAMTFSFQRFDGTPVVI